MHFPPRCSAGSVRRRTISRRRTCRRGRRTPRRLVLRLWRPCDGRQSREKIRPRFGGQARDGTRQIDGLRQCLRVPARGDGISCEAWDVYDD